MKGLLVAVALPVLGLMCWRIGLALADDAANMAIGLVFGMAAGLPVTLLVLATSSRRRELERDEDERYERYAASRADAECTASRAANITASAPQPQRVTLPPVEQPIAVPDWPVAVQADRYGRFAHLELGREVQRCN